MTRALLALLFVSPAFAAEPIQHRVLAADRSTGKVAVVAADGKVEWEFPNTHDVHDLWLLPSGNVLTHTSHTTVVEISTEKAIVWKYEAKPKPGNSSKVEVHTFQRLPDGNTMVAEYGPVAGAHRVVPRPLREQGQE